MRHSRTLAGFLLVLWIGTAAWAGYTTGPGTVEDPLVLQDDFEGYTVGDLAANIGPWSLKLSDANCNYSIAENVGGRTDQAIRLQGKYSGAATLTHWSSTGTPVKDICLSYDINIEQNTVARTSPYNRLQIADANGQLTMLYVGVYDDGNPNTSLGQFYVRSYEGDSTSLVYSYFGSNVSADTWYNVKLWVEDLGDQNWQYTFWINDLLMTPTPVAFNTTTSGAAKGDMIQIQNRWQDSADTYYDNINWTTAIPEPTTMSLLVGGIALAAMRRRRRVE